MCSDWRDSPQLSLDEILKALYSCTTSGLTDAPAFTTDMVSTRKNIQTGDTIGVHLTADQALSMYRTMYISRRLDEREMQLKRQQKIFFQVSGSGHEAALVAVGQLLRSGYDWFFPYYRDRALCLALGITPLSMLLEATGSADGPYSGGRQMPNHWGDPALHIVSQSSPTGTQWLQAVGCAEVSLFWANTDSGSCKTHADEVTYVSGGEGATSEGEFYESLNTACTNKVPVLYLVEDNAYAISVPVNQQTPGGSISRVLAGYPNLLVLTCDGTDPIDSFRVLSRAVSYCRSKRSPALVHASVVRLHSHSLSDDHANYRTTGERELDAARDPLPRFRRVLTEEYSRGEQQIRDVELAADAELEAAVDSALAAPAPSPASVMDHIYSIAVDPSSSLFCAPPKTIGPPKTMVELIRDCLADEMANDSRVLVFGQDVADCGNEEQLPHVPGKGGIFKCTHGLQKKFGSKRVFNTPIGEANIVGRAFGMALRGLKPVVEIQFFDYIWPAMLQIRDELAVLRWRSNNNFKCPIVIRVPIGGYLGGGGIYHSQSGEVIFCHIPGIRVVMPSTALDANGMLRTAIRCDDPVLFLEPKHLYRQVHNKDPYPGPDYMVPFCSARLVRQGSDLTVLAYGSLVVRCLQAAEILSTTQRISAEVIDLRSLSPYDWPAIEESVRKTSRALIVYEDWLSWGYGAEIAARIAEEMFGDLEAPVTRLGAADCFCAYHPLLEHALLPQVEQIIASAKGVMNY